jgi:S-adenosylmethionine/arginine decarboxylase-like enzyme
MRYGKELIIDLHNCDVSTFTRKSIKNFMIELCKLIDMRREDLHFWDDYGVPEKYKQKENHTSGISAVQFILTSNITIHTLDKMSNAYVDIFSCKPFNANTALKFTKDWFQGTVKQSKVFDRL